MADYNAQIANLLAQRQQQIFASQPALVASTAFKPIEVRNDRDAWMQAGANLAQGVMGAYGLRSAQNEWDQYRAGLAQILAGSDPMRSFAAAPQYAEFAVPFGQRVFDNNLEIQKKVAENALDTQRQIEVDNVKAQNQFLWSAEGQAMARRGILGRSAPVLGGALPNAPVNNVQGLPAPAPAPVQPPQPLQGMGQGQMPQAGVGPQNAELAPTPQTAFAPTPGAPLTYQERLSKLTDDYLMRGVPMTQAIQLAEGQLKPELEDTQKQLTGLQEARAQAQQLRQLGSTVLGALPGAGQTGPGTGLHSSLYGAGAFFGNDSAESKVTNRQLLDSVLPDVIKSARAAGAGAMSDAEMRLYAGAGPGTQQTPETNRLLAEAAIERANRVQGLADFKDAYYRRYGTLQGADQLWQQSIESIPVISAGADGRPSVQSAPDWKERLGSVVGLQQPQPPQGPPTGPAGGMPPSMASPTVPPALQQAIIQQESGGRPDAVSPKGAVGLMQVMPPTGKEILIKMGRATRDTPLEQVAEMLKDPEVNTEVGLRYYTKLLSDYNGDEELALAAYNAGPGRVNRALKAPGPDTFAGIKNALPSETRKYVPGVLGKAAKLGNEFFTEVGNVGRQVLDGVMMGTADEAIGAIRSQFSGKPYEEEVAAVRQSMQADRRDNPVTSIAANVVGGVASPVNKALGAVGLLGKGATALGTIGRSIGGGAVLGGAYGFGSGEGAVPTISNPNPTIADDVINRLPDALMGATVGTAGGAIIPAIGAATRGAVNAVPTRLKAGIGNMVAELPERTKGAFKAMNPMANERGSIILPGDDIAAAADDAAKAVMSRKPTEAELMTYKMLGDAASPDQIRKALVDIVNANSRGGQMLLAEAIDQPAAYGQARFVGTRPNVNALKFVEERAAEAPERIKKALGASDDAITGAASFRNAAQNILEEAENTRTFQTSPLFRDAIRKKPLLESEKLTELIKSPRIKEAIASAQKDVENSRLPKNHTRVLQDALSWLNAEIQKLQSKTTPGNKATIRQISAAKAALENEVHALNPGLREAREAFERDSSEVNKLVRQGIKKLADFEEGDAMKAVSFVMQLEPKQIQGMRETFVQNGQGTAWKEMLRSYVTKAVNERDDNQLSAMLRPLIGGQRARLRLKAALGDDLYAEVEPLLRNEQRYVKGAKLYQGRSDTEPNQARAQANRRLLGKLMQAFSSKQGAAEAVVDALANPEIDERVIKEMAQIFFNPARSQQALERLLPLSQGLDQYGKLVQQVGTTTANASRMAGIVKPQRMLEE